MEVRFITVYVADQEAALLVYTSVLGCTKKADIAMDGTRFLTVEPMGSRNGVQVILAAIDDEITRKFVAARYAEGEPAYSLNTEDIIREVGMLRARGVKVVDEPHDVGPVTFATIDDGCGNLVYVVQAKSAPEGRAT
jgi:4-hydroxyphenylpyruvate dioxygenase-like putative hemolysin